MLLTVGFDDFDRWFDGFDVLTAGFDGFDVLTAMFLFSRKVVSKLGKIRV